MKKLVLTLVIILGMGMSSFAGIDGYNEDGGLFGRGTKSHDRDGGLPGLPGEHGLSGNQNADAPLGSGIVALIGFGAAYAFTKKRNED